MYMSKPGINIKIIFIVTSVNKFTVLPLRTLRIHERKTCLPIEKPGGCSSKLTFAPVAWNYVTLIFLKSRFLMLYWSFINFVTNI